MMPSRLRILLTLLDFRLPPPPSPLPIAFDLKRPGLSEGKPPVFSAWTSHDDEVTHIPVGAVTLAGNRSVVSC